MTRIPQFSIAARLPLGIGLLLVSVLGGMSWTAYQEVRRSNLQVAADRLTSLTEQFRTQFELSLQKRSVELGRLAGEGAISACLADPSAGNCDVARLALERHVDDGYQVLGTELWNADGLRVLVYGPRVLPPPGGSPGRWSSARTDDLVGIAPSSATVRY